MKGTEQQMKRAKDIKAILSQQVKMISDAFIKELQQSERVREDKYDGYVERWYLGLIPSLESDSASFYLEKFSDLSMVNETPGTNLQTVYQYIISNEFSNNLPFKYSKELTLGYNKIQENEDLRIKIL